MLHSRLCAAYTAAKQLSGGQSASGPSLSLRAACARGPVAAQERLCGQHFGLQGDVADAVPHVHGLTRGGEDARPVGQVADFQMG